jgi:type II secretory pathway pseudopilin PulG
MSVKRNAIFSHGRDKQHGAALLIMLIILVVGIATVLVNSLTSSTVKTARQEKTAAALAQARDALIGYAITYGDTHTTPPEVHGYLPCPDTSSGSEGVAVSSCGVPDVNSIGKLPWATLDLSALRDGDGECLWYAVSGTYKSAQKTSLMNWDTNGLLQAFSSDGTLLTQPDNRVVAVIFAPGAAQSGQDRSGTTFPVCGGNYTATNYLDNDTVHNINNTDIATGKFIQGTSGGSVNDQMLFITRQDIWNAIKKRNDFGTFVSTLLSAATACLSSYPNPVTINFDTMNETPVTTAVGSLYIGRIPSSALTSCVNNNLVTQWRDNLLYANCTSSGCLGSNNGSVIFAGEKNAALSQQRITNADKNNWSNYLEDTSSTVLTAFTTGNAAAFPAASSYSSGSPSTDVLAYIP